MFGPVIKRALGAGAGTAARNMTLINRGINGGTYSNKYRHISLRNAPILRADVAIYVE